MAAQHPILMLMSSDPSLQQRKTGIRNAGLAVLQTHGS
jgi:hypothetical protein